MPKDDLSVSVDKSTLRDALNKLRERLGSPHHSNKSNRKKDTVFLEVFIVFDELHALTKTFKPTTTRNDLAELRQALRTLLKETLFTFFLSTTGKISQFTPPHDYDPDNRIYKFPLTIPTPFIWLGFNQLMGKHKIFEKYKTLEHVTSLDCIAHMGRPL